MSATDPRTDAVSEQAREAILDGLRRLANERGESLVDGVDEFTSDEYDEVARVALAAADAVDTRVQQLTEARSERDELLGLLWQELSIGDGPCVHRLRNGDCAVCGRVKELRGSIALRESVLAEVDASPKEDA